MISSAYRFFRNRPPQYALLSYTFFLLVPTLFISENIGEFSGVGFRIWAPLIFLAVSCFLLILLLEWIFRKPIARLYFRKFIEFCFFFVLVTGLMLPVSISAGMIDPSQLPINKFNFFLAIAVALTLSLIGNSKAKGFLYTALTIFILINTVILTTKIYPYLARNKNIQNTVFALSAQKNIVVLSMDGVPGSIVREVLDENPDIRENFTGFTFFDQVASSSPATGASTAASLYGNFNFKNSANSEGELWKIAPDKLITNRLNNSGYKVSTYGVYSTEFEDKSRRYTRLKNRTFRVVSVINFAISRMLTRYFVVGSEMSSYIESQLQAFGKSADPETDDFVNRVARSHAPKWKMDLALTFLDFLEYSNKLKVSESHPVAHFMHFTFTHFPVEFDRSCEYFGDIELKSGQNQNRKGIKSETHCVLTQLAAFLSRLKSLGVFEKSLIVLKSDHGKPVEYFDTQELEGQSIRGHKLWGYARYMPFLAIKDFGSDEKMIQHNEQPVLLDDLAKTICIHSEVDGSCVDYHGYDLLSDNFSGIEDDLVTFYVVESADSDYRYDNHEAITFKRGWDAVESLHKELTKLDAEKVAGFLQ